LPARCSATAAPASSRCSASSVEAELEGTCSISSTRIRAGFIGRVGTTLGEAGINIGTFNLGRRNAGGDSAVLLLSVD
jgi:D-3-phosphoglycerate dehydrogenase